MHEIFGKRNTFVFIFFFIAIDINKFYLKEFFENQF